MQALATAARAFCATLSILLLVTASWTVSAAPAAAETYTVKMGADSGQLKYVPDTLTVSPGDSVEFVMNKLAPHNAVFDPSSSADSSLATKMSVKQLYFKPGDSFTIDIPEDAEAGTYPFYCVPHRGAGMAGKLIIE